MTTAIIFGRFRIVHSGHLNMIRAAVANYDNVIVGISSQSVCCRSLEVLREYFPQVTFQYCRDPFSLLSSISNSVLSESTFIAGADRQDMINRLLRYYPLINTLLVERDPSASSSTACRAICSADLTGAVLQLVEQGLAESHRNSLTIVAQYCLENINDIN